MLLIPCSLLPSCITYLILAATFIGLLFNLINNPYLA